MLKKLFGLLGGSNPPEDTRTSRQQPVPLRQPDLVSPHPHANMQGCELPLPEISEINNPRTSTHGGLYIYGKLVQHPDGPIVHGFEHQGIGSTAGLDPAVKRPPYELFFVGDRTQTRNYPWNLYSGLIMKRTVRGTDGKPWIVCGTYGARSEDGFGTSGRLHKASTVLAFRPEDWSVAIIPQLDDLIGSERLTERHNDELPPLEIDTSILDQPLPEGWMSNRVKGLLEKIVTGKDLGIQTWDLSKRDFLKDLFYAALCLPEAVARRISFATGCPPLEKSDSVRVVHGMGVTQEIRLIGGEWKDITRDDIHSGTQYFTQLTMVGIDDAKTPRDLMKKVATLPSHLVAELEKRCFLE